MQLVQRLRGQLAALSLPLPEQITVLVSVVLQTEHMDKPMRLRASADYRVRFSHVGCHIDCCIKC
jgi:hypothetical protein